MVYATYSLLISQPVLLFLVLTGLFVLIERAGIIATAPASGLVPGGVLVCLSAIIMVHVGSALAYLVSPVYFDHIEPNVAIVSALFNRGLPLFHELDAAPRYAMLYGPTQYLVNGLSYTVFGYSDFSFKLTGVVSLLAAYLITGAAIRRLPEAGFRDVLIGLGIFAVLALFFRNYTFWSKSDSMMLAFSALGVLSLFIRSPVKAALLCGIALGITVNGKLHAAAYFLPLVALHYRQDGWRSFFIIGCSSLVVALAPFLVFANVSLLNYLALIQSAGRHGVSLGLVLLNSSYGLFMSLPLLCLGVCALRSGEHRGWVRENILVIIATVSGVLLIAIVGAKPGSGTWHMLPFLPHTAVASVWAIKQMEVREAELATWFWLPFAGFLAAAFIKGLVGAYYGYALALNFEKPRMLIADVRSVIEVYPDKNIHMGYGDGSRNVLSFVRTQLVFAGNPYLLDTPALMDFDYSGVEIPPDTITAMNSDPDALWLIPKGQEPFLIKNWFTRFQEDGYLFKQTFRDNFHARFEMIDSTEYFDLWAPISFGKKGSGE